MSGDPPLLDGRAALVVGAGELAASIASMLRRDGALVLVVGDGDAASDPAGGSAAGRGAEVAAALETHLADGAACPGVLVQIVDGLPAGAFEDVDPAALPALVEHELAATFERCQQAARVMLVAGGGTIVIVLGAEPGPPSVLATAVRHGVIGMTKVLGTEWARRGVRVVAVSQGAEPGSAAPVSCDQVADVVAYVCSPGASFVTGSHVLAGAGAAGPR